MIPAANGAISRKIPDQRQHGKPNSDYGYSHNSSTSQGGTYTGTAPPTSYQPSGQHSGPPSQHDYSSPPPGSYGQGQQHQQGGYGQQQSYPTPQSYGSPSPSQHQHNQYGGSGGHNQYPPPQQPHQQQQSYGGAPSTGYGQQGKQEANSWY